MRGGANGARVRLSPQKDWDVNKPTQLSKVLSKLEDIQNEYNRLNQPKKVSLADLITLGGNVAIEKAIQKAGLNIKVPFLPGRTDARQDQTDLTSFSVLEPVADGFRNYQKKKYSVGAEGLLIDKAQLLRLTAPEMTVLVGGMRMLKTNYRDTEHGVFTKTPESLTNDFFVNLLDMSTAWMPSPDDESIYVGRDRTTGEVKWTGTRVDLMFGSNSQLRAIAEVYACDDGHEKFVNDFVSAWNKVMNADRFEIK